jgi:hypothetical protein
VTGYEPSGVLVAGRPHTGKTSYLAVLYLAIVSERAAGLRLGTFRDDREYLNRISQRLQTCEPPEHTEVDEQQELSLSLLVGSEATPTLLRIPDTSGETWEAALTMRQWPVDLDARVREANAVMIFTHPKVDFDPGTTIVQANAAEAALRDGTEPAAHPSTREPDERAPTQVELVDLLQLLREQRGPRPTRACLVVSAYDLVSPELRPDDWVSLNCPLFAQYADVNQDWLDVAVYGVSAQGGSFRDDQVRDALTRQDAVERSLVLSGDGTPVGVDDPILWMLRARD